MQSQVLKVPTGLAGFDAISFGGLPAKRVTVVLGAAGTGKTNFALAVLVNAVGRGERALFVAFEEPISQLIENASSFAWPIRELVETSQLGFMDVSLSDAIIDGGDFDLAGTLALVGARAKQLGATHVVFDGIDMLLERLQDRRQIHRELVRLRSWTLASGMTAVITAKLQGDEDLLAEYSALPYLGDCVLRLVHRMSGRTAQRSMRLVKYRGSPHNTNEIPFAMTVHGIEIASATGIALSYPTFDERVSTGVKELDRMLAGGYIRGTCTLVTGAPGSAKTTIAGAFAAAACARGERTLFVSFDEAPSQLLRNLGTFAMDLQRHVDSGVLHVVGQRARADNPEAHVSSVRSLIEQRQPSVLVLDPISALRSSGDPQTSDDAALQLLDIAKRAGITTLATGLAHLDPMTEASTISVATGSDTWIHLWYLNTGQRRRRALDIIKSRGTDHVSVRRELLLAKGRITLASERGRRE